MLKTRVLEYDPELRRTTLFHFDPFGTEFRVTAEYDVDPLLDDNRRAYRETDERAGWKGEWHLVARVPLVLYHEWMQEGRHRDQRWLRKWANDPDNRFFRVRPGRV